MEPKRCPWARSDLEIAYHDAEWGRPLHDERRLFELLILEGMQAGLSWNLILNKREAMREAFLGFAPQQLAETGDEYLVSLMDHAGIIRNRAKIFATRTNARAYLELCAACGGLGPFLWNFVDGRPIVNRPERAEDLPASTPLSERVSRDLKKRGFRFVGPTIVYSLLQSAGMINDHMAWCDWCEIAGN